MNRSVAFAAGAMAVVLALPASATTMVSFHGGSGALPANASIVEDFESFAPGTPGGAIGPSAFVYNDSVSGQSARPAFGSTGNFASVLTGGAYIADFGPTKAFSFVLGSLDTYNTLTLKYENGTSQAYIGGQIINDLSFPSGNQISGETNGVVTFTAATGPRIVGAVFQSSQNSFEFDNLATGAVPEPATWALMIGGFGLIGAASRRRNRPVVTYA